jgi:hypothetical protein
MVLARFEIVIEGDELTPEVEEAIQNLEDDLTDLVEQSTHEAGIEGEIFSV